MKSAGISSPYLSPTCFPIPKMSKAQWDRDRNMDTIMEISVAQTNHLFCTVRISASNNSIFVHFVGWLYHVMQTPANLQTLAFELSYKHDINSNILFLGSFFPQHRFLDIFRGRLYYFLTP